MYILYISYHIISYHIISYYIILYYIILYYIYTLYTYCIIYIIPVVYYILYLLLFIITIIIINYIYIILYYIISYHIILYHIILYYIVLYILILYCIILYYTIIHIILCIHVCVLVIHIYDLYLISDGWLLTWNAGRVEVTAVMVNSSLDQATQDKEALKAWESARRAKQKLREKWRKMGETESIHSLDHLMNLMDVLVLNLTQAPSLSSTPDAKRSCQVVLEWIIGESLVK